MDATEFDERMKRLTARPPSTPVWDAVNLRTMGTRVRTFQAEAFDGIVKAKGLTRYEAIRRFCVSVIADPSLLDRLPWR